MNSSYEALLCIILLKGEVGKSKITGMSYEAAIKKAWDGLRKVSDKDDLSVDLLGDTYYIDLKKRASISSLKAPTKDFLTILLLHYLIGVLKKPFSPQGEWISFKEVEGGEFYYPAFREGAINPILKKYGNDPKGLLGSLKRFKGSIIKEEDVAIEFTTFDNILVRIILWKGDEEFGPEATIMFDRNLTSIFTTEDIALFLRLIAHKI
jgi:hypothetical protein